jgi:hypothetical protein
LAIVAWNVLDFAVFAVGSRTIPGWQPFQPLLEPLSDIRRFAAVLCAEIVWGLFASIALLLFVVLFRIVIRRVWVAYLTGSVLLCGWVVMGVSNPSQTVVNAAVTIGFISTVLWMIRRFGLMAVLAATVTNQILTETAPMSFSSWYAGRSLVTLAIPAAVAGWTLWLVVSTHRGERRQWTA